VEMHQHPKVFKVDLEKCLRGSIRESVDTGILAPVMAVTPTRDEGYSSLCSQRPILV
jgi:hypothetical protein